MNFLPSTWFVSDNNNKVIHQVCDHQRIRAMPLKSFFSCSGCPEVSTFRNYVQSKYCLLTLALLGLATLLAIWSLQKRNRENSRTVSEKDEEIIVERVLNRLKRRTDIFPTQENIICHPNDESKEKDFLEKSDILQENENYPLQYPRENEISSEENKTCCRKLRKDTAKTISDIGRTLKKISAKLESTDNEEENDKSFVLPSEENFESQMENILKKFDGHLHNLDQKLEESVKRAKEEKQKKMPTNNEKMFGDKSSMNNEISINRDTEKLSPHLKSSKPESVARNLTVFQESLDTIYEKIEPNEFSNISLKGSELSKALLNDPSVYSDHIKEKSTLLKLESDDTERSKKIYSSKSNSESKDIEHIQEKVSFIIQQNTPLPKDINNEDNEQKSVKISKELEQDFKRDLKNLCQKYYGDQYNYFKEEMVVLDNNSNDIKRVDMTDNLVQENEETKICKESIKKIVRLTKDLEEWVAEWNKVDKQCTYEDRSKHNDSQLNIKNKMNKEIVYNNKEYESEGYEKRKTCSKEVDFSTKNNGNINNDTLLNEKNEQINEYSIDKDEVLDPKMMAEFKKDLKKFISKYFANEIKDIDHTTKRDILNGTGNVLRKELKGKIEKHPNNGGNISTSQLGRELNEKLEKKLKKDKQNELKSKLDRDWSKKIEKLHPEKDEFKDKERKGISKNLDRKWNDNERRTKSRDPMEREFEQEIQRQMINKNYTELQSKMEKKKIQNMSNLQIANRINEKIENQINDNTQFLSLPQGGHDPGKKTENVQHNGNSNTNYQTENELKEEIEGRLDKIQQEEQKSLMKHEFETQISNESNSKSKSSINKDLKIKMKEQLNHKRNENTSFMTNEHKETIVGQSRDKEKEEQDFQLNNQLKIKVEEQLFDELESKPKSGIQTELETYIVGQLNNEQDKKLKSQITTDGQNNKIIHEKKNDRREKMESQLNSKHRKDLSKSEIKKKMRDTSKTKLNNDRNDKNVDHIKIELIQEILKRISVQNEKSYDEIKIELFEEIDRKLKDITEKSTNQIKIEIMKVIFQRVNVDSIKSNDPLDVKFEVEIMEEIERQMGYETDETKDIIKNEIMNEIEKQIDNDDKNVDPVKRKRAIRRLVHNFVDLISKLKRKKELLGSTNFLQSYADEFTTHKSSSGNTNEIKEDKIICNGKNYHSEIKNSRQNEFGSHLKKQILDKLNTLDYLDSSDNEKLQDSKLDKKQQRVDMSSSRSMMFSSDEKDVLNDNKIHGKLGNDLKKPFVYRLHLLMDSNYSKSRTNTLENKTCNKSIISKSRKNSTVGGKLKSSKKVKYTSHNKDMILSTESHEKYHEKVDTGLKICTNDGRYVTNTVSYRKLIINRKLLSSKNKKRACEKKQFESNTENSSSLDIQFNNKLKENTCNEQVFTKQDGNCKVRRISKLKEKTSLNTKKGDNEQVVLKEYRNHVEMSSSGSIKYSSYDRENITRTRRSISTIKKNKQ